MQSTPISCGAIPPISSAAEALPRHRDGHLALLNAARRVVGPNRQRQEQQRAPAHDAERLPVDLEIEGEADQLDGPGERVVEADVIEPQAPFPHLPQRIERRGGEEHREDHEVHDTGEVLQLLDGRGQHHAERAEHHAREDERRQRREVAPWRQLHAAEPGDEEKGVDLEQRYEHAGEQARQQEEPARERRGEQHPHRTHLAVVDHRQRALHALEQLDHREQAWRDVHVVGDVGLIRRDDRDAERGAEARGKNNEPNQWPNQGREKPLALLEEAQQLAPDDAEKGADVMHDAHAATSSSVSPPMSSVKAPPRSFAPVSATTSLALPRATIFPRLITSRSSSGSTSSNRWVAHSTPILSLFASSCTWRTMARRVGSSSPMVGSSRRRSLGLCSRLRAISTRRRWPPLSERTRSLMRSAMSRALSARSIRSSASLRFRPLSAAK